MTDDILDRCLAGLTAEAPSGPFPLGLAVSGGGDSMALLHLAVAGGLAVRAVTVNHGLRPEAADEAAMVAQACAGLGVAHDTLHWQGWDGRGNLQDQARRARLDLIGEWARANGISAVAQGHTQDDLAETFLMRLARGAGIDGLAAMRAARRHGGILWLRPLLAIRRAELRDWLAARGLPWAEDASNDNPRYDRIKARRALAALGPLGIDAGKLAQVAGHLAQVQQALDVQTHAAALQHITIAGGDVVIGGRALTDLPPEVLRRLVTHSLQWVASAEYGARGETLARAIRAVQAGRPATLHGCRLLPAGDHLRIFREARAVEGQVAVPGELWDGRWWLTPSENRHDPNGLAVRALGAAGLALCKGWRDLGVPRASLLATPAVWSGDTLVAAPLAGCANGWTAITEPAPEAFFLSILSH